jgi:ABC-type uncharacterized transport system auxiliary subunit
MWRNKEPIMPLDKSRTLFKSLAVGIALLCVSCASLKMPYPDKAYFAIEPGTPDTASSATAPGATPVILIRRLSIAAPYDATAFVYKTGPAQFATDYYNAFITEPASLLTSDLIQWLSATRPPGSIIAAGSGAHHDLILEGNITALYADLQNKSAPRAMIQARFMLIDERNADAIVLDKTYSVSVPADNATAPSIAAAFGRADRQILQSLAGDLPTNSPSEPRTK